MGFEIDPKLHILVIAKIMRRIMKTEIISVPTFVWSSFGKMMLSVLENSKRALLFRV